MKDKFIDKSEYINTVYFSLGTNVGDRLVNLNQAFAMMNQNGIEILQVSSIYQTSHWSNEISSVPYPDYYNVSCKARTNLEPIKLLETIKSIEKKIGRNLENAKNFPREIDIDILFYNSIIMKEIDIEIPHPRFHLRGFVLVPLNEIAFNYINPKDKLSIKNILNNLTARELMGIKIMKDIQLNY
jgi:2-amino-4-hydroxy-6-hydroxymethyldihydropteridine diphosphokinase